MQEQTSSWIENKKGPWRTYFKYFLIRQKGNRRGKYWHIFNYNIVLFLWFSGSFANCATWNNIKGVNNNTGITVLYSHLSRDSHMLIMCRTVNIHWKSNATMLPWNTNVAWMTLFKIFIFGSWQLYKKQFNCRKVMFIYSFWLTAKYIAK